MTLQVRSDYANPFLAMPNQKAAPKTGQPALLQGEQEDQVSKLQTKQQQLQVQMLLLKTTGSDSAGASAETEEAVKAKLEQVSAKLRTAKGSSAKEPKEEEEGLGAGKAVKRPDRDWYERGTEDEPSPGIYKRNGF